MKKKILIFTTILAAIMTIPRAVLGQTKKTDTETAAAPTVEKKLITSNHVSVIELPEEKKFEPFWKIGALLQMWYVENDNDAAADTATFRTRRAEVKLYGSQLENTRWFTSFDLAKTLNAASDNKVMQDFGIGITVAPNLEFIMGQTKTLTSMENFDSSAELLFPERSVIGRTYGEKRDPGLSLNYKTKLFSWGMMASNGVGANQEDNNGQKDFTSRMEFSPFEILTLGGFVLARNNVFDRMQAYGGNINITSGRIAWRGESVMGYDEIRYSRGYMTDLGYKLHDKWVAALRYESYQPDIGIDNTGDMSSIGASYLMAGKSLKLQLSVGVYKNLLSATGSPTFSNGAKGVMSTFGLQSNF